MTDNPDGYDVPAHWRRATIADTGSYVNGVAFKNTDWHDDGLPIIRIQNLTDESKPFNLTRKEIREESRVFDGDILVSWSATLDAFRWRRGRAVLNQHIFKVFPDENLVRDDFLFYLLKEAITEMSQSAHAHGSTMKHINRGPFLAHELFIPPLDEQKQIVDEIETQFARLDDAVAALDRARTRLKRYRASVLKAACEGRLVPTEAELARQEGRDYTTGMQLLAKVASKRQYLWEKNQLDKMTASGKVPKTNKWKSKYKQPDSSVNAWADVPEGWSTAPLTQLTAPMDGLTTGPFGTLINKSEFRDSGVPIAGIANIGDQGFILGARDFLTPEKAQSLSKYVLEQSDLILSRSGTIGEVAVIPETSVPYIMSTNLMRIRLVSQTVTPKWIEINFKGNETLRGQLMELCKGSTRPFVNLGILAQLLLPIPPIPEQERIIAEVERRLSIIGQLETSIGTNLKRTEALRQSILRRAFSGRLTGLI